MPDFPVLHETERLAVMASKELVQTVLDDLGELAGKGYLSAVEIMEKNGLGQ